MQDRLIKQMLMQVPLLSVYIGELLNVLKA